MKKKWICMLLAMSLVFSSAVSLVAQEDIVSEDAFSITEGENIDAFKQIQESVEINNGVVENEHTSTEESEPGEQIPITDVNLQESDVSTDQMPVTKLETSEGITDETDIVSTNNAGTKTAEQDAEIVEGSGDLVETEQTADTEETEEAEEVEEEEELLTDGSVSGPWTYSVKTNGTVRIDAYDGNDSVVEIPSVIAGKKVTEIGENVFLRWNGDSAIKKVTIPNTIQTIGWQAFYGCSQLESIDIPNSVTEIGSNAFNNCISLKTVKIPDSITTLYSTFQNCTSLTSVSLPNSLTSISNVFYGCTALKSISIPESVKDYNHAFFGCTSLTEVKLPKGNEYIPHAAFSGCTSLTAISIPSNVNTISDYAFSGCTNLRSINLDRVSYIGGNAFESCVNLTSIKLSQEKVKGSWSNNYIGKDAFRNCIRLQSVVLSPRTTTIGENAFYDCSALSSLTFYRKMTSVDQSAFRGCSSLKNVYYGGTENDWKKITISSYNEPLQNAKRTCLGTTKITIPAKITTVPGSTVALAPKLSPANTWDAVSDIEWTYGYDSSIQSIDEKGNVTFYSYNYDTKNVTVKATIGDVSAQCVITLLGNPRLKYTAYQQKYGKLEEVSSGSTAGYTGLGLRMEALTANIFADDKGKERIPDLNIEYRSHVQGIGWQGWKKNGELTGTTGQSKRLEAIEIKLTGANAKYYDIYYRVHAQRLGWMSWAKNGEPAGTSGYGYRLEAIIIQIMPKGEKPFSYSLGGPEKSYSYNSKSDGPSISSNTALVGYNTHVQTYGWQEYSFDGKMAGTSGQSKRLEGIHIKLQNQKYSGSIIYRTHIQKYGWQGWKKDGAMSGTSGESKRLEGIQIYLTGDMAKHYDVYYRVHAQTYGWLDYAKNGVMAGTSGLSRRLEGINIVLVPKGGKAPGATARPYVVGPGGKLPDNPYIG